MAKLTDSDLRSAFTERMSTAEGVQSLTFARCQALCGLAQLCVTRARNESNPNNKGQLLNEANAHLTAAAKLAPNEQMVQLGKGLLLLASDNPSAARGVFTNAKKLQSNGARCAAASMALAQLTFTEGQYRKALTLFAEVLSAAPPEARGAARCAVGACYIKLGEYAAAQAAYDRALAVAPHSAAALAGQAAVELLAPERVSVASGVARAREHDSGISAPFCTRSFF